MALGTGVRSLTRHDGGFRAQTDAGGIIDTRTVVLATGRPRRTSPARILGRSIFWWLDTLHILRASRDSRIGRYLMRTDPFPGTHLELGQLCQRGIQVVDRLVAVEGRTVSFRRGATAEVEAVVWATGYRDDSTWVDISEVKDAKGGFVHQRGVSPVPGLYFIGRSWQWTRGSALLHGVGADAADLIGRIAAQLDERPTAPAGDLGRAAV